MQVKVFRQCSLGWHLECSNPEGDECECPCHHLIRESLDQWREQGRIR